MREIEALQDSRVFTVEASKNAMRPSSSEAMTPAGLCKRALVGLAR